MNTNVIRLGIAAAFLRSRAAGLLAALMLICSIDAASNTYHAISQEPKYEMGTFYMCLLIRPPNFSAANLSQDLVKEHLKHIQNLLASGKGVIAGPFADNTPVAGVIVLNASSAEEARAMEEADPFVKTGGLSVEVLKWWAAKGIMKPPPQPLKQKVYYLTFLRRSTWNSRDEATVLKYFMAVGGGFSPIGNQPCLDRASGNRTHREDNPDGCNPSADVRYDPRRKRHWLLGCVAHQADRSKRHCLIPLRC